MPGDSTLTLFIPDLFGFQSILSTLSQDEIKQLPVTRFPVLEKWLTRGSKEKSIHQSDVIFSEFGIGNDIPYAALSLLAENNNEVNVSELYWLRADPINLQADRDTLLLAANEELALTQDEANTLVEMINSHFADEAWTLYAPEPHRWYLGLEKNSELITKPLSKALGHNIDHFMASGEDANYWLNVTNEIQMLLHGSNVNFERESRNRYTANGVWLWGGGRLPENNNLNSNFDRIITNNILFSGIGLHYDSDIFPLDDDFIKHLSTGNNFVVLDMLSESLQRQDLYTFMQMLHEVETNYLGYCNELLLNGKITKLKLITDDGMAVTVTKKQLRHWWKRIKPFADFKYE